MFKTYWHGLNDELVGTCCHSAAVRPSGSTVSSTLPLSSVTDAFNRYLFVVVVVIVVVVVVET